MDEDRLGQRVVLVSWLTAAAALASLVPIWLWDPPKWGDALWWSVACAGLAVWQRIAVGLRPDRAGMAMFIAGIAFLVYHGTDPPPPAPVVCSVGWLQLLGYSGFALCQAYLVAHLVLTWGSREFPRMRRLAGVAALGVLCLLFVEQRLLATGSLRWLDPRPHRIPLWVGYWVLYACSLLALGLHAGLAWCQTVWGPGRAGRIAAAGSLACWLASGALCTPLMVETDLELFGGAGLILGAYHLAAWCLLIACLAAGWLELLAWHCRPEE